VHRALNGGALLDSHRSIRELGAAQVSVLTANYGPDRTNSNLQETQLTTGNVAPGSFGALGAFPADGEIFAQPLYVSGVTIGQTAHNMLLIATEHNSVYAYDADQISPTLCCGT